MNLQKKKTRALCYFIRTVEKTVDNIVHVEASVEAPRFQSRARKKKSQQKKMEKQFQTTINKIRENQTSTKRNNCLQS